VEVYVGWLLLGWFKRRRRDGLALCSAGFSSKVDIVQKKEKKLEERKALSLESPPRPRQGERGGGRGEGTRMSLLSWCSDSMIDSLARVSCSTALFYFKCNPIEGFTVPE